MKFCNHNPNVRKRLQYGLLCWSLLIGIVGPLLQTLCDCETFGLYAVSDPGLTFHARKMVAHSTPGVVFAGGHSSCDSRPLVALPELTIASISRVPVQAPLAVLFFPLRP